MDQLEYCGHYTRQGDIKLLADSGIKKMRYPVLWEKHAPLKDSTINWEQTENNLLQLSQLGVSPIAGLVHHGSGPAYVDMQTDSFALGLADYAAKVAVRFPWIDYYTPVNEPLTTARFCGLYGKWYPHGKSTATFLKVLISECKATVLAMQEIRKVNPGAKLVQTEDLGKVHSTKKLSYQADFENERRWLSFDLLCGNVNAGHPLRSYILENGIREQELEFFLQNPCKPDIMGLNHYLTSERYLDHQLSHYPRHTHGGNGRHRYADVEAIRVEGCQVAGTYKLVKEAWERFKLPLAITEVHLHCTREEQLRWFNDVWNAAIKLEQEKVPLLAVTAWAMLGSFGWNKLLQRPRGDYEAGVFDLSSGDIRPTALFTLIKSLAADRQPDHLLLAAHGWWQRPDRIIYPMRRHPQTPQQKGRPLLIIGQSGTLGRAFATICTQRNINYCLMGRIELDITREESIARAIEKVKPWAIINTAGYVRVDDAEDEPDACFRLNADGPLNLALYCEKHHIKLITFSSDLVFDGMKGLPYTESDPMNAVAVYGKSKVLAEQYVSEINPDALIIRTSAFFGPWDRSNFVYAVCQALESGHTFEAADDLFVSPTYVPDLAAASIDLLIDNERGTWHFVNQGSISWYELACKVAERMCYPAHRIVPLPSHNMKFRAKRPRNSAMKTEKGVKLPTLEDALNRYFKDQQFYTINAG